MNQTFKNDKKPSFGPDFGLFWPTFSPPNLFHGFTFQAIIVCNFKKN